MSIVRVDGIPSGSFIDSKPIYKVEILIIQGPTKAKRTITWHHDRKATPLFVFSYFYFSSSCESIRMSVNYPSKFIPRNWGSFHANFCRPPSQLCLPSNSNFEMSRLLLRDSFIFRN